jgi:NADH:ubiquinone oxidoreductase subunit F (NADH-binding)
VREALLPRHLTGPVLLRPGGLSLEEHRCSYGPESRPGLDELLLLLSGAAVRGRGGAGFPVATKIATVAHEHGRPSVVVNLSEGEPASQKDRVLAATHPHLLLDGAEIVGHALRSREIHLVVPRQEPGVERSLSTALQERGSSPAWRIHRAEPRFVAGEGSAVVELIEGRRNLPVTSRQPTAVAGLRGRPTMLSNAETFAQVAAVVADPAGYAARGTRDEPGTRLLTLGGGPDPIVVEVEHGCPWSDVLPRELLERPVLLGGYHGSWARAGCLRGRTVATADLAELELSLGAGVVLPLAAGRCPLVETSAIVGYLAAQSAHRCGPCFNGLPALADAFADLVDGAPSLDRIRRLVGLVVGRGACSHPDGTAKLVRSALAAFPDEVDLHGTGACSQGWQA